MRCVFLVCFLGERGLCQGSECGRRGKFNKRELSAAFLRLTFLLSSKDSDWGLLGALSDSPVRMCVSLCVWDTAKYLPGWDDSRRRPWQAVVLGNPVFAASLRPCWLRVVSFLLVFLSVVLRISVAGEGIRGGIRARPLGRGWAG